MAGDEMTTASPDPAGVMTAARTERNSKQHEKSGGVGRRAPTGSPRGSGRAASDGGEVRSSGESG
jgi:hypothetical protein